MLELRKPHTGACPKAQAADARARAPHPGEPVMPMLPTPSERTDATAAAAGLGERAPDVIPVYLRAPLVDTGPRLRRHRGDTPGNSGVQETLADAITRRVLALLEDSLHAAVASAIRAMAPALAVSLPDGNAAASPTVAPLTRPRD